MAAFLRQLFLQKRRATLSLIRHAPSLTHHLHRPPTIATANRFYGRLIIEQSSRPNHGRGGAKSPGKSVKCTFPPCTHTADNQARLRDHVKEKHLVEDAEQKLTKAEENLELEREKLTKAIEKLGVAHKAVVATARKRKEAKDAYHEAVEEARRKEEAAKKDSGENDDAAAGEDEEVDFNYGKAKSFNCPFLPCDFTAEYKSLLDSHIKDEHLVEAAQKKLTKVEKKLELELEKLTKAIEKFNATQRGVAAASRKRKEAKDNYDEAVKKDEARKKEDAKKASAEIDDAAAGEDEEVDFNYGKAK